MARFDVQVDRTTGGLVLNCQHESLDHLDTRVALPLVPTPPGAINVSRLHPRFAVQGVEHVMITHLLAAVPARDLGPPIASLAEHHFEIGGALDLLLTGV